MINSSTDFESKVRELSRTFCCRLKKSGSVMDCTVKKLSVYKGMMGEKVALGSVYIPYMEAEIQEFSESLMGDVLTAEVGLLIGKNDDRSKNFEYIKMGTFQVSEESYNDGVMKIKAVGTLSTKFIGLYTSELTYPASVADIAAELQSQTGVNIGFDSGIRTSGVVEIEPKGLQRSEMICYLAGLVGGCATEDADGNVVIKRLSSGNTFSMTGDVCTQIPSFSSSYDLTGLRVVTQGSYEDENGDTVPEVAFSHGAPIKMEYSNPFMTQAAFDMFATAVVDYSFNPATVPIALGDPRIEPWDTLSFTDRQGEVYKVPCLNIEHTFDGGFSTKIIAPGEESVSESSAQVGPISKMVERTYTKMEAVENMLAGKIEATEVDALYAKISDLEAAEADIGSAKMDIADINTLLFGSATGKVLQSEFANATIALISDATIDSAKIVSIIADKIMSGQLNTNKVNVQSESGQLKITGDTIIIKDTEKTRVQIGKDANNDYNIYILDAEGNIMFDATGVHESAIKNPIIVDDMVAENANISAGKLDIDSLFSEINGSEKTIKATKVVFDDTGQELSVAFSKIVTDIDGIEEQIQSQGTSLNVLQDKIQSKVWQQDINSTIDNLQIGSRNLLKGTKDCSGVSIYGDSLGVKSVEDESGFKYIEFPTYESDSNKYLAWVHNYNNPLEIEELLNKEFVLSYEYRTTDEVTDAMTNMCVEFAACSDESTIRQVYKLNYLRNTPVNNEWQKITVKGTCTKEYLSSIGSTVEGAAFENCTRFWVRIYAGPNCPILNIRKCKLEIGNKATDWTPAPEDIESEVNTKYSEMSTKYSEMVQDLAGFKTTVSETYTTKQEFQSLEIGGRNLIRYTKELPIASEHRGSDGVCLYGTVGDLEPTVDGLKITFASNVSTALMLPLAYDGCIDNGETLTLSFMYRGNITNTGLLYLLQRETPNVSFNLSSKGSLTANETQWQKFEATFSMPTANEGTCFSLLLFYGLTAYGTDKWIEIKKGSLQLEKGSKATAWTPALEDTEDDFNNSIESMTTQILQTAGKIVLDATAETIRKSELDEYKTIIENALTASAEGFNFTFNQLESRMTDLGDEVAEKNQYIRLVEGQIVIGRSDSLITAVFTNDALEFRYDNQVVAKFTNEVLEVRNIAAENQMSFGDIWAIRPGTGNNLDFVWIGG